LRRAAGFDEVGNGDGGEHGGHGHDGKQSHVGEALAAVTDGEATLRGVHADGIGKRRPGVEEGLHPLGLRRRGTAPGERAADGLFLDLEENAPEVFAHEGELVALVGNVFGEALEFVGAFEAGRFAAFHGEGFVDQRVGGGDEQVAAAAGGGRAQHSDERNGHRHRPHLEAGLLHADDLRIGFQLLVNAVENGVVIDLEDEEQAGFGNRQRAAGQRDGNGVGFVEREDKAAFAADGLEEGVPFQLGFLFKLSGQFLHEILRLRKTGLGDLILRHFPQQRQIHVRKSGERGVGGQQIEAGEGVRFRAAEFPEEAGAGAGIMVQQHFVAEHSFLDFDGTHAHAGDVLDAAILDQMIDEVKGLVDVGGFVRREVGHGGEGGPPGFHLGRKMLQPLRGAEIKEKVAAGVELVGDLGKAGALGRHRVGGFERGGRLAAAEVEAGEAAEQDHR